MKAHNTSDDMDRELGTRLDHGIPPFFDPSLCLRSVGAAKKHLQAELVRVNQKHIQERHRLQQAHGLEMDKLQAADFCRTFSELDRDHRMEKPRRRYIVIVPEVLSSKAWT